MTGLLTPSANVAVKRPGPILVTGANGFLGGAVVRRLLAQRREVRAAVRRPDRQSRLAGLTVEVVAGDMRDAQAMARAAEGCAAILHLAGPSSWSILGSPNVVDMIVSGTQNVLQAAQHHGNLPVVFVSSLAALGPSATPEPRDETAPFESYESLAMPYVLGKRLAERACHAAHAAGLPVAIVRPAEIYGPGDEELVSAGNLLHLLERRPVVVCSGGACVVDVDDVAEGVIAALDRGRSGEVYLLGGDNLHHYELASLLLDTAGLRAYVWQAPAGLVRAAAKGAAALRLPFPVPQGLVPYATRYWFIDNSKARRELGLTFRSARETLSGAVRWLHDAGHWRGPAICDGPSRKSDN